MFSVMLLGDMASEVLTGIEAHQFAYPHFS